MNDIDLGGQRKTYFLFCLNSLAEESTAFMNSRNIHLVKHEILEYIKSSSDNIPFYVIPAKPSEVYSFFFYI